jgi:hypothetical protein
VSVAASLSEAIQYLHRGWAVVPVHGIRSGRCTCGRRDCPAPGKHPRIRWETYRWRAPREDDLEAWFHRWPDSNLAVVTGVTSGVVVLDVDPRNGGDDELSALERRHGPLPPTPEVRTGGGGVHLYFTYPEHPVATTIVGPGLDLKADGGLVVVPPSIHASGHPYEWEAGADPDALPLAELPHWLRPTGADPRAARPGGPAPARSTIDRKEFAELWRALGVDVLPGDRYYRCPFHDDHHPSLHVDAEGCRWYCFGCRRGGGPGRLRRLVAQKVGALPSRSVVRHSREHSVATTWIQWPTIQPGGTQDVVGEASHVDALEAVADGRTWAGPRHRLVTASLEREPGNPHDHDAVRVVVGGETVGYLPRDDAPGFHELIGELAARDRGATARARLTGGWDRGPGGRGAIGIELDIDPALGPLQPGTPFLPDEIVVDVVGEEKHPGPLELLVEHSPGRLHVATLAEVHDGTGPRLDVEVNGVVVGALGHSATERYLPVVRAVVANGFPTTCRAIVARGVRKHECRVLLPRPAGVTA